MPAVGTFSEIPVDIHREERSKIAADIAERKEMILTSGSNVVDFLNAAKM